MRSLLLVWVKKLASSSVTVRRLTSPDANHLKIHYSAC
nr:MAG TPA: hypothetical protein [Crassvirales sp.]